RRRTPRLARPHPPGREAPGLDLAAEVVGEVAVPDCPAGVRTRATRHRSARDGCRTGRQDGTARCPAPRRSIAHPARGPPRRHGVLRRRRRDAPCGPARTGPPRRGGHERRAIRTSTRPAPPAPAAWAPAATRARRGRTPRRRPRRPAAWPAGRGRSARACEAPPPGPGLRSARYAGWPLVSSLYTLAQGRDSEEPPYG